MPVETRAPRTGDIYKDHNGVSVRIVCTGYDNHRSKHVVVYEWFGGQKIRTVDLDTFYSEINGKKQFSLWDVNRG